jgi:hypothetical protein
MANDYTHFAFVLDASAADNALLDQHIRAINDIEDHDETEPLPAELDILFRTDLKSGRAAIADILDDMSFGFQTDFVKQSDDLTFYADDGSPNLRALAQFLHKLFPSKLPMGFVYSETGDKARPDGFGGGLFVICSDTVVQRSLPEILAEELEELGGRANAAAN